MIEVPPTEERVALHSPAWVNEQIRLLTRARVMDLAHRLDAIDQRLREIEQEWDIERTLEANAATISLVGLLLSTLNRKWTLLPVVVAGFLLQHAVQGWCPPVEWFRRLGIRTAREIEQERFALMALRGDFEGAKADGRDPHAAAVNALRAVGAA